MPAPLDPSWSAWLSQVWPDLEQHGRLPAPRELPPLAASGFSLSSWAEPCGQTCDWALSLPDESRIHIHEYADGSRVVHRDQYDPNAGLGSSAKHFVFETVTGRFLTLGVIGFGIALLASRFGLGFARVRPSALMHGVGL